MSWLFEGRHGEEMEVDEKGSAIVRTITARSRKISRRAAMLWVLKYNLPPQWRGSLKIVGR